MVVDLRSAGMGWPNDAVAGGNRNILVLPSPDLLMLGSEHWHYDEAVRDGKRVLFRGMARQGFRPAELGWDARRYVDEITRDAVRVSEPITDFVAWNELNLQDERGDQRADHGDLTALFSTVGSFQLAVLAELRKRPVTRNARLHFGAWAPKDETDYTQHWYQAATAADVIDVHAYGHGAGIIGHIDKYRALFPGRPVEITEWHSDGGPVEMDRETLALFANESATHPDFRAYYFLWQWHDPPAHQRALADAIAVWGNGDRYGLFRDPPVVSTPVPPAPEPEPLPQPEPTMPDPWEYWAPEQIAAAAAIAVSDVRSYWPKIHAQLVLAGIADRPVQVAAIGTTAVESSMKPIHEYGTEADWSGYSGGAAYAGRGFIQLTHDYNYRQYGEYLAELWGHTTAPDMLVAQPDLALDPDVAAAVLALYFVHHTTLQGYGIPAAARAGDWEWVRRLVQGGVVGLPRLRAIAEALGGTPVPLPTPLPFNPDAPCDVQPDDWSCSVQSMQWMLRSIGRSPGDAWMEQQLVPAIVSKDVGLKDASGAQLAAWLNREYGSEMGFTASAAPVTFDDVLAGAGANPTIVGGRQYGPGGHWVGIRRADEDGLLELANPAPNYTNTGTHLDRAEWAARGPWSAIYIDRMALVGAVPVPEPEPVPQPTRAQVLVAEIRDRLEELASLVA